MEKKLDLDIKEDCFHLIRECREKMSSRYVTEKQWEKIEQQLAQIVVLGHEEARYAATATLTEMEMRYPHMVKLFWNKKDANTDNI
jgi:hypothetical protein